MQFMYHHGGQNIKFQEVMTPIALSWVQLVAKHRIPQRMERLAFGSSKTQERDANDDGPYTNPDRDVDRFLVRY